MVLLAVRGDQIMGTEENHDSLALRKLSSGGAGIAESFLPSHVKPLGVRIRLRCRENNPISGGLIERMVGTHK